MKSIEYTYTLRNSYCSEFSIVPKSELGESDELVEDIYNVYAIGETDETGKEYLKIRTRYYFSSKEDKKNFLYCFFESVLYIEPNVNIFGTDISFIEHILMEHDEMAHKCLNGKRIDTTLFPSFNIRIRVNKINYSLHAKKLFQWMNETNK